MFLTQKSRLLILLLLFAGTAGCDQVTKHLARTHLGEMDSIAFPGGLGEFRLAENPGAFLSLGDALPEGLRVTLLTTGVAVGLAGLLAYLILGRDQTRLSFIGLALLWSGGTSNLIDRVMRHGHVTDFMYLQAGPLHTGVFNVADVAIMAGIAVFAWDTWRQNPNKKDKNTEESKKR